MDHEEKMMKQREIKALESIAKSLESLTKSYEREKVKYDALANQYYEEIKRMNMSREEVMDFSDIEDGGGTYE